MVLATPLESWTESTFKQIVDDAVQESLTVEFKGSLNLATTDAKREAAKDISAMANAAGGWIFFGIDEKPDKNGIKVASAVTPITGAIDLAQRLEDVVRGNVSPPLAMRVKECAASGGGVLLAVRVERSHDALHQVDGRFYRRTDKAARPMLEPEVSQAYEVILRRRIGIRDTIGRRLAEDQPLGAGKFLLSFMPHTISEVFDPAKVERHGPIFAAWESTIKNALAMNDHGLECELGDYFQARIRRDGGVSVGFVVAFGDNDFHAPQFFREVVNALLVTRRLWQTLGVTEPFTAALSTHMTGELFPRVYGERSPRFPHQRKMKVPFKSIEFELAPHHMRDDALGICQRILDRVFQTFGEKRCPYFAEATPAALVPSFESELGLTGLVAALREP